MQILTDKVDALFAGWDKPDSPGCALAIIKDGEISYKRAYGMADLERNVPLSPASVFDIGSTGKQFTAMIIAILANQGALQLDGQVHQYIPEMPSYGRPITIRHLLHHTSGLRDYTALMDLAGMPSENFYHEDELLDLILRQKGLNFNPGEEYLYSNSGYFLLGVIAKRVTGQSLLDLIQAYILQPLGMQATSFNDHAKRIVKNRALGYSSQAGGGYCTDISFCGGYGDGPLISTVEDLFLWDRNFYENKLGGGGQALIQQLLSPGPGALSSGETLDYAFGLMISPYKGLRMVSHGGSWAGYRAELIRFPDRNFSVICLANLGSIAPWTLARQVADLYLADEFPEQAAPSQPGATEEVELPPHHLERLSGFYRNQKSGTILELSTRAGKLVGEVSGQSFQLAALSSTLFKAVETPDDVQIELEAPSPDSALTLNVSLDGDKPEIYRKMSVTPIDLSQLSAYSGKYYSDELNTTYIFRFEAEQLFLKRGYGPEEALKPVGQDIFTSRELNIQFVRNEQGHVCAFNLGTEWVRHLRFTKIEGG
jgi:CubicO group peptidase (beta-lactamase class C family)